MSNLLYDATKQTIKPGEKQDCPALVACFNGGRQGTAGQGKDKQPLTSTMDSPAIKRAVKTKKTADVKLSVTKDKPLTEFQVLLLSQELNNPPRCRYCGEEILGKRAGAKFCNDGCRIKSFRENRQGRML